MSSEAPDQALDYRSPHWRGAALALMWATEREVCMDGPAGTGKSFAALWKMHLRRIKYPGSRGLLARKTLISLKSSTLVTYREQVLGELLKQGLVKFWAARADEPAHYAYWNGSKVVIAGLDKPGKAMSTEYDDILIDEALDCEEADAEALLTRIQRPGHLYGVPGRPPYAQLVLVTNPGPPTHWLNQRMLAGRTRRLLSHHIDNPAMTADYLALFAASLTGARRDRLLYGMWKSAEGTVYEDAWLPERNHLPRATYTRGGRQDVWGDCGIPAEWPRYMAIDWGYRAPMSVQWWAKEPRDGALILYREIYTTMRTVEEVAKEALGYMGWKLESNGRLVQTRADADPLPREIVADVDPGDRATWEAHFGLSCYPATKGKGSISDGIQAVTARMQTGRLIVLQGSLVARDPNLDGKKKPCGFAEEVDVFVWDTRGGRAPKEVPMDDNDHAMDPARYLVQYLDRDTDTTGGYLDFHAPGY